MKFSSISDDFFDLCSFDSELLKNKRRRPHLFIARLIYGGKRHDFAIPFRSNLASHVSKDQYFPLPPSPTTEDGNIHALHFIKMFPIRNEYLRKFHIGSNTYYEMLSKLIEAKRKVIINMAQDYLTKYESGLRMDYCTDIRGIYVAINKLDEVEEAAPTSEKKE